MSRAHSLSLDEVQIPLSRQSVLRAGRRDHRALDTRRGHEARMGRAGTGAPHPRSRESEEPGHHPPALAADCLLLLVTLSQDLSTQLRGDQALLRLGVG